MKTQNVVVNWVKFKKLVKDRGHTFETLGIKTRLGRRNIENIKNHNPSYSKMAKIADALDVSLDEFRKGN